MVEKIAHSFLLIGLVFLLTGAYWLAEPDGCQKHIPLDHVCCNGQIVPLHECCGNSRLLQGQTCCGMKHVLNLRTEICCAGNVHPRATTDCCDGLPFPKGTCSSLSELGQDPFDNLTGGTTGASDNENQKKGDKE